MKLFEILITAVLIALGVAMFSMQAIKVYNGCPPGQVLVQSIPTWECIRR